MSLESGGCSFTAIVNLSHTQQFCLVPHISKEKLNQTFRFVKPSSEFKEDETHLDKTKQAFMAAMEEFSNSPAFEALTYQLENNFSIQVHHSIDLRMPS